MPAKINENSLTLRDAEILKYQLQGKTLDETAELVGCSRDTVKRSKVKPAYRDAFIGIMERQGYALEQEAEHLIALTDANKTINVGGEEVEVNDNITRFNAIKLIADIYGLSAPKEIDLKHSQPISDEELSKELLEAELRLNGTSKTDEKDDTPIARESGNSQ